MSGVTIIKALRSEFNPFLDGVNYDKDWDEAIEAMRDLEAGSDHAPSGHRFGVDESLGEFDCLCY